jgi:hypothetical protein
MLLCFFDPDPGSRPEIQDREKQSEPGIRIQNEHPGSYISESLETIFGLKILKLFDADPDPGSF